MNSFKKSEACWNDPPTFNYNEIIKYSESPKRNTLNKRVAFPINCNVNDNLSNVDSVSTSALKHNLSSLSVNEVPSHVSNNKNTNELIQHKISALTMNDSKQKSLQSNSNTITEDNYNLEEILANLDNIIQKKRETLKINNKDELIKKKLQIMKDSWKNKLPVEVKQKLFLLSEALKKEDIQMANEIHVSLMIDYSKLCCEFISAFRQLINID